MLENELEVSSIMFDTEAMVKLCNFLTEFKLIKLFYS